MFKAYVLLIPIYTTVTLVEHVYIYPREYAEFFKLEFYVASLGRAFCFKLTRIWRNWKRSMRRQLEFEFLTITFWKFKFGDNDRFIIEFRNCIS